MRDFTSAASKVRSFLTEISAGARANLFATIEHARQSGTAEPIHDFLFEELRKLAVELGEALPSPPAASRVLFEPLEPFLIDIELPHKLQGRVPRPALDRLYAIMARDIAPEAIDAFENPLGGSRSAAQWTAAVTQLRADVMYQMAKRVDAARTDSEVRRKLTGSLGGDRSYLEFEDIYELLRATATIESIRRELNAKPESSEADLVITLGNIFRAQASERRAGAFAAVLIRQRLEGSARLPRTVVALAGTSDVKIIMASAFAPLIDITISDIEWAATKVLDALANPHGGASASEPLREYTMLARQLRAALDIDSQTSDWNRRITELRTQLSTSLAGDLNELSPLLRRCVKSLRAFGNRKPVPPDEFDVGRARILIEIFDAVRLASSELALNELVHRVRLDIETYVDFMAGTVVEDIRGASEGMRSIAIAHADALLRIHGALYGESRTAIVRRSVEVAAASVGHALSAAS